MIQTIFYKKNAFKMFKSSLFMFLDLPVSCDKNKKIKLNENLLSKGVLKNKVGWIVEASEAAKDCGQFHVFGTF